MNPPKAENLAKFLRHYLEENYPEKVLDLSFINQRGQHAKDKFNLIFAQTEDYNHAYDLAMDVLLDGYLFSKKELINEILMSKFNMQYSDKKSSKKLLST